jgi:cytochrome c oxidase subunit 2
MLTGCATRAGAPAPHTEQAEAALSLWRVLFWSAVAIGVVVLGLIGWCLVRYRRGADESLPVQTSGNVRLELFYTAVPFVLAATLFAIALVAQSRTEARGRPDLLVDVTGFQWQWRFHYPEQAVTVLGVEGRSPQLVLPVDHDVQLRLRSVDVIHSFFVPAFMTKRDVVPGQDNELSVRPTRLGTFRANCAEFCGLNHDRMGFEVRIVTLSEFGTWVAARKAVPQPVTTAGGGT